MASGQVRGGRVGLCLRPRCQVRTAYEQLNCRARHGPFCSARVSALPPRLNPLPPPARGVLAVPQSAAH
eukprot:536307-Prorocentrum_minimum.AAC.1